MKSIPYSRQTIAPEDLQAVAEVLTSDLLTQGPQVELFEKEFAAFVAAPFATTVSNGTAALHLAAQALGVKKGDRVLVTANTFVASANCIRFCGGDVEFADIDPETFCLDLEKLRSKIESKPRGHYKGIVFVDFAGYMIDFQPLRRLADTHGLWILEDACHALGAEVKSEDGSWQRAGSGYGVDVSVFSFHPVKHLATGEGGMITTRDPKLDEKVKSLRLHGITRDPKHLSENHGPWYYEMQTLGFNYRLPDILCALGRSQLRRMESNLKSRRAIAERYFRELEGLPLSLPQVPSSLKHAYHLFVVQVEARRKLYDYLRGQGIFAQVHYVPVHLQPYYIELYGKPSLPVVEKYYAHTLSLPMFHGLSDEDQTRVIAALKGFF